MKLSKLALMVGLSCAALLTPAYARGGGGHGGGGGHSGGGHAGGGARGGFSSGAIRGGGVSGFRGGYGYYGGRYYAPSLYFGVGGWGYPYSYYGYDPYAYGYAPYGYDGDPAYSTPPPAAVPQNYGYPPPGQTQPQSQAAPQPPSAQPESANAGNPGENFYLIAFTDHTIQAATAYKVEGNQFHWITREGEEKVAPLSSVDVRFSQQINRDRNVDLRIP